MTTFELLDFLDSSSYKSYGENLKQHPSRIIPQNISDNFIDNKNKIIKYILPCNSSNYLICDKDVKLPEPCAYFTSPNSLLKSFLYLTNEEFYENVHLPKKADDILNKYLKTLSMQHVDDRKYKKLIQKLMNSSIKDTDPSKNLYFKDLFELLEKKYKIEIIKCDTKFNFLQHISKKTDKKKCLILQYPSGTFCPYGLL